MNTFGRGRTVLTLIGLAAALGLAACGGSNNSNATAASPPTAQDTVSASTIGGNTVLVDSQGDTLYTPEQEASGKILCTGSCESIWMPLTASGSMHPTASADVTGKVGTVKRPDGTEQVTIGGAPLYTFAEDSGPGAMSGDGVTDQFNGHTFTWHAVGADGSTSSSSQAAPTTTSSGGGYGGY
jgi:predicted lipoprotein with Yx(FWY)xxD motif